MKKEFTLKQIIVMVLLLPISVPIAIIVLLTKGREFTLEDSYKFINKFMNVFEKDINKFLEIKTIPLIKIRSTKYSSNIGEFIVPGLFNFDFTLCGQDVDAINRTDDSKTYINLYTTVIYNKSLQNNFLTKLIISKTIIHELTHYKQFIENRFVGNSASTFDDYMKEPCEIEARKSSKSFTYKHFIKLIHFLIMN